MVALNVLKKFSERKLHIIKFAINLFSCFALPWASVPEFAHKSINYFKKDVMLVLSLTSNTLKIGCLTLCANSENEAKHGIIDNVRTQVAYILRKSYDFTKQLVIKLHLEKSFI